MHLHLCNIKTHYFDCSKTLIDEKPVQMVGDLGINRIVWIQGISQMLALSCSVVCHWCGDIPWHMAEARVPLGVFLLTEYLLL